MKSESTVNRRLHQRACCLCALVLAMLSAVSGCKEKPAEPSNKPAAPPSKQQIISAEPNPVPAGEGLGATMIRWNTGDGSWAEVWLAVPGQPEKLFTAGPQGSLEAPWIAKGLAYEFRLYAGKEHQKMLGSVKVTRQ
jgi:hypothetical protein